MSNRKHALISALKTIQNMNKHSAKGDWRKIDWQEWWGLGEKF